MARTLQSNTITIVSLRPDGTRITRRYPNANPEISDEQVRLVQEVVNSFDNDTPAALRLTRVENVDTEEE